MEKKKTAEFSYKRKEDMNDLQKKGRTIMWNVNDEKEMQRCNGEKVWGMNWDWSGGVRRAANNRREPVSTNLLLVRRISL